MATLTSLSVQTETATPTCDETLLKDASDVIVNATVWTVLSADRGFKSGR